MVKSGISIVIFSSNSNKSKPLNSSIMELIIFENWFFVNLNFIGVIL